MAIQRIQKFLAAAGIASRRACEEFVEAGRVKVNGVTVRELPCLVDPEKDKIAVDGKLVLPTRHVYFLLNKPKGVFCTHNDPAGRHRAIDCLVGVRERVFPVGRLDAESMGLLLLTNDGELTQKLTHPRFGTPKTYRAEVQGCPTQETLQQIRQGVWLSEGHTAPATIEIVHKQRDSAILEITLREVRNREVRRLLAKLGHRVRRLTRIRMGKLTIHKLPVGAFRPLTPYEVKYLYELAAEAPAIAPTRRPPRSPFNKSAPRPRRTGTTDTRAAVGRGGRTSRVAPKRDSRRDDVKTKAPTRPSPPQRGRRIIPPS